MILQNIAFRDYETGGINPHRCQPLQIACVMIDARRLEIIPNSLFKSLIKPESDEEKMVKLCLDPVSDEALGINHLTREELKDAPLPNAVWKQYTDYLANYNTKGIGGQNWDAPIKSGFNNSNFDDIIDKRMCQLYGPKLNEFNSMTIYHPVQTYDVKILLDSVFNGHKISPNNSMGMDAVREYFGYKIDGAHSADVDVLQGADLLLRFFKLFRNLVDGKINLPEGKKIKFKGCVGGKI